MAWISLVLRVNVNRLRLLASSQLSFHASTSRNIARGKVHLSEESQESRQSGRYTETIQLITSFPYTSSTH